MSNFSKGDTVKLKSGGPKMTVTSYRWLPKKGEYDETAVNCTWFNGNEVKSDQFPIEALEIADSD